VRSRLVARAAPDSCETATPTELRRGTRPSPAAAPEQGYGAIKSAREDRVVRWVEQRRDEIADLCFMSGEKRWCTRAGVRRAVAADMSHGESRMRLLSGSTTKTNSRPIGRAYGA